MGKYNFLADLLDRFHNSAPPVQIAAIIALCLIFTIIGWILTALFSALFRMRQGRLAYTIYLGDDHRAIIFKHHKSGDVLMLKPDMEKINSGQ